MGKLGKLKRRKRQEELLKNFTGDYNQEKKVGNQWFVKYQKEERMTVIPYHRCGSIMEYNNSYTRATCLGCMVEIDTSSVHQEDVVNVVMTKDGIFKLMEQHLVDEDE